MTKVKFMTMLILILLIPAFICGCAERDYIAQIERYAEDHPELTFGEILDFDWDIAYNDLNYYGRGEVTKELSGYEFEIDPIGVDHLRRFLFFKEGKLVKDIRYEYGVFQFPDTTLEFYPDTVFAVEWFDYVADSGRIYPHLIFSIKE